MYILLYLKLICNSKRITYKYEMCTICHTIKKITHSFNKQKKLSGYRLPNLI